MADRNDFSQHQGSKGQIPSYDPLDREPGQIVIPVVIGADPLVPVAPTPGALDSFGAMTLSDSQRQAIDTAQSSSDTPGERGEYAGPGQSIYGDSSPWAPDIPGTGGQPRHPRTGRYIPRG